MDRANFIVIVRVGYRWLPGGASPAMAKALGGGVMGNFMTPMNHWHVLEIMGL